MQGFLWMGSDNPLMGKTSLPKANGGLYIRIFEAWNKDTIFKINLGIAMKKEIFWVCNGFMPSI